jgi:hypothetical protein
MAITNYTELKTAVGNYLMRTDCDEEELIALFEATGKRDHRLRRLKQNSGAFVVDADDLALPADFDSLESWRHDGPTYFGEIAVVSDGDLGIHRAQLGTTGVPVFASILNTEASVVARFAPAPDAAYNTRLVYWATLTALSATQATNWLLTAHPDIYLYGTLLHAAPFLHEDERLAVWATLFKEAADMLHEQTLRRQFSGDMRMRPRRPIGG